MLFNLLYVIWDILKMELEGYNMLLIYEDANT